MEKQFNSDELYNVANAYAFNLDEGDLNTNRDTFIAGANWQKERYMYSIVNAKSEGYNIGKKVEKRLMIDKACKWLENNLINYWSQLNANNTESFTIEFKKAMEG